MKKQTLCPHAAEKRPELNSDHVIRTKKGADFTSAPLKISSGISRLYIQLSASLS